MRNLLNYRLLVVFTAALILVSASGCGSLFAPPPTPTPKPTNTPLPTNAPVPTNTPLPPAPTDTLVPPTPSNTLPPPPTPRPVTPVPPTATAKPPHAILVYYINKNEKGNYGCNEALWYLNTGIKRSEAVGEDIKYALRLLLTYYSPTIGSLYHAGYASHLAVGIVKVEPDGSTYVNLTGEYVKTDDPCDASRFKDQIKVTIKQFPQVLSLTVTINGVPIGSVFSHK